jgi:hypothetical protein
VNVKGKAQANLNDEIVGLENLPDGTIINFFNANWKDSVAVTNGKYSINVPKGATVSWNCEFTYNKRVWVPNSTNPSLSKYENISYKFAINGSGIFNSNTVDKDFSAGEGTDLTVDPNMYLVALSVNAQAELDESIVVYVNIPNNAKIYFYTSSWGATATVTNGAYSLNIPKGEVVNFSIEFTSNKKVSSGGGYVTKPYNYKLTGTVYFTTPTGVRDINAGTGTDASII